VQLWWCAVGLGGQGHQRKESEAVSWLFVPTVPAALHTQSNREENIRRIGEVGKLFADQGLITLVSFISPYRWVRVGSKVFSRPGRLCQCLRHLVSLLSAAAPERLHRLCWVQQPSDEQQRR
jgi:hypothetical protein